jgi:hypothetical protein
MDKRFMQGLVGKDTYDPHAVWLSARFLRSLGERCSCQITHRAGYDGHLVTAPDQAPRQFMMTRSAWLVESGESLVD